MPVRKSSVSSGKLILLLSIKKTFCSSSHPPAIHHYKREVDKERKT